MTSRKAASVGARDTTRRVVQQHAVDCTGLRNFQPFVRSLSMAAWLIAWLWGVSTTAAPYRPGDDQEVLLVLPRTVLSDRRELTALRERMIAEPNNAEVALELAGRYVEAGDQSSDPRFYGYARSALGKWWSERDPPSGILKMRAKLLEKDHGYAEAAADLERLLQREPRDVQAWITLSNIYRVLGRYGDVRRAYENMSQFAGPIPLLMCRVPWQIATGEAQQAYGALQDVLPQVRERAPALVKWVLTLQAEAAVALGDPVAAEKHYREGLVESPDDLYLLRGYADLLLDERRPEEVVALLRDHLSDTGVLLAAAIAAQQSGQSSLAKDWHDQLSDRLSEARLRGGVTHGRYEARFWLTLEKDPQRALIIATTNWEQQKEFNDARILLEAALAAQQVNAARDVQTFLRDNNTQHAVLKPLIAQLDNQP